MPTPSNPSPRRRQTGASPSAPRQNSRSGANANASARAGAARTTDFSGAAKTGASSTASRANDAGSKRRALKKKRTRQSNFAAWTLAGALTVVIAGMAFGVNAAGVKTKGIWAELQTVKSRVAQKSATLADLKAQAESGKKRLKALASAGGKERVLVENGYIKPGERLLLFPKKS